MDYLKMAAEQEAYIIAMRNDSTGLPKSPGKEEKQPNAYVKSCGEWVSICKCADGGVRIIGDERKAIRCCSGRIIDAFR
jgi:hypothetical protein